MKNEKEFITQYIDDSGSGRGASHSIIRDNPGVTFLENEPLQACWSIKVFKVCIEKIQSDSVVLGFYLSGTKLATATLNAKQPCVKVKESLGGDTAKVDATVCVDFAKKVITAKGKVCAAFVCVKFKKTILSW